MTETDTSPASVHHWDEFWRAREKAVQQEDIGSRDPAPAEYWDTFFRKEFESVRQPRLLDVACGVGAVTTIALRAARATTTDLAAYCADYADLAHLVGNDQVVLGIHRALYVIAHHARAAAVHRAGIRIGQGELLVRCLKHPDFELF